MLSMTSSPSFPISGIVHTFFGSGRDDSILKGSSEVRCKKKFGTLHMYNPTMAIIAASNLAVFKRLLRTSFWSRICAV